MERISQFEEMLPGPKRELIQGLMDLPMSLSLQWPKTRRGQQKVICFSSVEKGEKSKVISCQLGTTAPKPISDKMLLNQLSQCTLELKGEVCSEGWSMTGKHLNSSKRN